MITPIVEQVAIAWAGRVRFLALNADDAPSIAMRYGVTKIPSLILFDGGQEASRLEGAVPESLIIAMLDAHLALPKPVRPEVVTASNATPQPKLRETVQPEPSMRSAPQRAVNPSIPGPSPVQDAPNALELTKTMAFPSDAHQRSLVAMLFREAGLDDPDEATISKLCSGMRACGILIVDSRAPVMVAEVKYALFPSGSPDVQELPGRAS